MRNFLIFWFPVLAYSAIIFGVSSLPGDSISLPWNLDKLAHCIEYMLLSVLAFRALAGTTKLSRGQVLILVVLGVTAYGISDEFHQMFVPGRDASWLDVLADGAGGIMGAYLSIIFRK